MAIFYLGNDFGHNPRDSEPDKMRTINSSAFIVVVIQPGGKIFLGALIQQDMC